MRKTKYIVLSGIVLVALCSFTLVNTSTPEKDKLLMRLIPKDSKLVDQLEYKLVEEEGTLEFRRDDMREYIESRVNQYPNKYYSSIYLRLEMRDISGKINYHVAITKDKLGDIEFNLMMVNGLLYKNKGRLQSESKYLAEKLNDYVIKRSVKLVKMVNALHEDYRLEFADEMMELADHIKSIPSLLEEAKYLQFDVESLIM